MGTTTQTPYVEVGRNNFLTSLREISLGFRRRRRGAACITFGVKAMTISVPGASISIDATGSWPGQASFDLQLLDVLLRKAPGGDPLRFEFRNGRLYVRRLSVPATWQDVVPPSITVPLNATLIQLVSLKGTQAPARLISSGLQPLLRDAEREIEKRLRSAARILGPVGITHRDLQRMMAARRARETGQLDLR